MKEFYGLATAGSVSGRQLFVQFLLSVSGPSRIQNRSIRSALDDGM